MTEEHILKALALHVEQYVTTVAEHLMAEGAAIKTVYTSDPYSNEDRITLDVEAFLYFTELFARQLGGGEPFDLHWDGTSGWCLCNANSDNFLDCAYWMGDGLLPEPQRVASFVDTFRLSPDRAGSRERPYYRSEGSELSGLLKRLSPYVQPQRPIDYRLYSRFSESRQKAYYQRVMDALTRQSTDPMLDLPLRASELDSLLHLLEYVQVSSSTFGPGDFAALLANDLKARRNGGYTAAHRHRSAQTEAAERQQEIERYYGRKSGNNDSPPEA
ncbi:DUF6292 family protein [Streptomyces mirabilis]|uniref:DUF6292 family protein n=1 Tax=Streptomyces mirabilis TaxID=68239 RepID=UPI0036EDD6A4